MPPELQDGADPSTPQTPESPPPEPATIEASDGINGSSGTVLHKVPQSEFKRLKEKAREKGRAAAMAEVNSELKAAGYDSLGGLLSTVSNLKEQLASKPEPQPKDKDDKDMAQDKRNARQKRGNRSPANGQSNGKGKDRTVQRLEKENERLARQRQKDVEKWRREERRRKDAEKRLAAKDAEMELREIAIQAGVKDVDYAIRLMTRNLKGKSKEELASFDEREYFSSLKSEKPYLFGEVNIPATTGTGAGSEDSPPEPGPGEVSSKTGEAQMFDARTASKEEIDARLKELGIGGSTAIPAPPSSSI